MTALSSTCSVLCVKVRDASENPLAKPETTKHHSDDPQMETRILENSINKICSLLAVGFGDAGAEVIANNIRSGGDLNPMIPGNKVVAIFGFCDIRNFTDTTEVLQEDIMEFVNTIADIVHTEVSSGIFCILAHAIGCYTCMKLPAHCKEGMCKLILCSVCCNSRCQSACDRTSSFYCTLAAENCWLHSDAVLDSHLTMC